MIQERTFQKIKQKRTNLVLNLDVRNPKYDSKYPLPPGLNREETIHQIIEITAPHVAIVKMNYQFLLDLPHDLIRDLVDFVERHDCIPWVDYKLGDIGSTNEQALHSLADLNFKGITVHQVIGYEQGLENILTLAKRYELDVVSLLYMSHPGAKDYFQSKLQTGKALYQKFLEDGIRWGLQGFVVGATIPQSILQDILNQLTKTGEKHCLLMPGFGAQKGDAKLLKLFNSYKNILPLPASGRKIIYSWTSGKQDFLESCKNEILEFKSLIEKYYQPSN